MSTESSPGKKDPATQPIVPSAMSHPGTAAAVQAVANAPVQTYTYISGGRSSGP
jgi:hypothetical protein